VIEGTCPSIYGMMQLCHGLCPHIPPCSWFTRCGLLCVLYVELHPLHQIMNGLHVARFYVLRGSFLIDVLTVLPVVYQVGPASWPDELPQLWLHDVALCSIGVHRIASL
jgi:hypothetical protein